MLLAVDSIGKPVAIKTIRPFIKETADAAIVADLEDGLVRESQIQSAFCHEGIVHIIEYGIDDVLGICVVMDYIPGETLRSRTANGPLPPEEIFQLADQILQTLEVLHTPSQTYPYGIVHRDVTPKNILLVKDRFPKLGDFHMARIIQDPIFNDGQQDLRNDHRIDVRTDLYLFGRTFYEMVTGAVPRIIDINLIDPLFLPYFQKLVAPDIDQRFSSASLARTDLQLVKRRYNHSS